MLPSNRSRSPYEDGTKPITVHLGGLWVIPGAYRLARTVIVVRAQLDLADPRDQPPHPPDRRHQLGDGVLGGDRILQDGGVQHPPTSTPSTPVA